MALTINEFLEDFANRLRIDGLSDEGKKIDNSINHLISNLKNEFNDDIIEIKPFGSYKRGTNLSRRYDENSDIDLLVIFNHDNINYKPITYRKHLEDFSNIYYSNSLSFKAQPAVVLELNHIKYDLVPAYLSNNWFSKSLYIPSSDTEWRTTDPDTFEDQLNEKDKKNNYMLKPVIRLLKAWNAKAGYPLQSYFLEKEVVDDVYIFPETLEEYFFNCIKNLSSTDVNITDKKIGSLKRNAKKVRSALSNDKKRSAISWLSHILPIRT